MTPVIADIDFITLILGFAVCASVGLMIGYLIGARFKQKYLSAARELACLRGDNFQNVPTMGIPRAKPGAAATAPSTLASPQPATGTAGRSSSGDSPSASDAQLATARRENESLRKEHELLLARMAELESAASQSKAIAAMESAAPATDERLLSELECQRNEQQQQLEGQALRIAELERELAHQSELLTEAREIAAELAAESPAVVADDDESGEGFLEDVEFSELREQLEASQHEAAALRTRVRELEQSVAQAAKQLAQSQARETQLQTELSTAKSASAAVTTGTESWQLAQLHREHIGLQMQIDSHLEKIRQLTSERDASQSQTTPLREQVEQLRTLLAQQEAAIASLERERDALRTRAELLEQKG